MPHGSVSVVIPCYNHRSYVAECLQSVLAQDRSPDDVIVVDDGSIDGTLTVLDQFVDWARIIRAPHRGLRETVRTGLALSNADYVLVLASDDRLEAGALAALADVLDTNPLVGLAYGLVQFIDEDSHRLGTVWSRPVGLQTDPRPLIMTNYIPAPSVLARRVALFSVRQPQETLCGDWEWWLAVMLAGWHIVGVDNIVASYRRHGASLSQTASLIAQDLAEARMLDALRRELRVTVPRLAGAFRQSYSWRCNRLGWRYLQAGQWDAAREAFSRTEWGWRPPGDELAGRVFARLPALYRTWTRLRSTGR